VSDELNADKSLPPQRFPDRFWFNPIHFLAFGFGSGLAPKGPGTAGTLAAMVIYWWMQYLPLFNQFLIVVVAFIAGIGICGLASRRLGVEDHPGIVWDEFVGYWLTMLFAPPGLFWMLLGFVLFRLFDILKPWPIGWVDRHVGGGFGIMVDDVIAGLFAGLIIALGVWFGL
jgi:phosphatidylglycerophosphatase A